MISPTRSGTVFYCFPQRDSRLLCRRFRPGTMFTFYPRADDTAYYYYDAYCLGRRGKSWPRVCRLRSGQPFSLAMAVEKGQPALIVRVAPLSLGKNGFPEQGWGVISHSPWQPTVDAVLYCFPSDFVGERANSLIYQGCPVFCTVTIILPRGCAGQENLIGDSASAARVVGFNGVDSHYSCGVYGGEIAWPVQAVDLDD